MDSPTEVIPTDDLIHRATTAHLRTVLIALLATHPELDDQVRGLLRQRPNRLNDGITTTARLAAFQPGWLYQPAGWETSDWFRILEIGPMSDGHREATLEPAYADSVMSFPGVIVDNGEPFAVKIPEGRL